MPLVRVDVVEGRSKEELQRMADAVQEVFVAPDPELAEQLDLQPCHLHRPGVRNLRYVSLATNWFEEPVS